MTDRYENPLCQRYASEVMQRIFSDDNKFSTWRKLWVALAESQSELGLDISRAQIDSMKAHIYDIDYDAAAKYESQTRHDVMAHIRAYGDQCPEARPVIHLGATSAYVGDNTDIILMRAALLRIRDLLIGVLARLYDFAEKHKALPCLAYTHFQAAQPTTVGKRATLWMQDLCFDLEHLDFVMGSLKMLGCRGATGTGASFLRLFGGDHGKVLALEQKIAAKMGFGVGGGDYVGGGGSGGDGVGGAARVFPVSGQTYSRKIDFFVLSVLSGIAQSAYKFSNDIRLLAHMKEIEEPFEQTQVGSSAMPYKRNPMRCERMASLARYVAVDALNPALTAQAQWLERTLDDSANRRVSIPEAFLASDAILAIYQNVAGGLIVYPNVIKKRLDEELPFMAAEDILMHCVIKGGDRQALHERIRGHSMQAAKRVKLDGLEPDLLERIASDEAFGMTAGELNELLDAGNYTGRAKEQTEEFLLEVSALLDKNHREPAEPEQLKV